MDVNSLQLHVKKEHLSSGRCPLQQLNGIRRNAIKKPTPIYARKLRKPCELFSPASMIEQENRENSEAIRHQNQIDIVDENKRIFGSFNHSSLSPLNLLPKQHPQLQHSNIDQVSSQLTRDTILHNAIQVINQYSLVF